MNLFEALEILNMPAVKDSPPLRVYLGCGFTPLHLETFLGAHLRNQNPTRHYQVSSGMFGDLAGNLERLDCGHYNGLAVVIEWSDLDTRLGMRALGGWQPDTLPDILACSWKSLERIAQALRRVPLTTALLLPTLPLPPLFSTCTSRSSTEELVLRRQVASFAESLANRRNIAVVSQQRLDEKSPHVGRFDLRTEVIQGFPYKPNHASAVGELLAGLILGGLPKKGLITDLDDTLWAGVLGERGVDGIAWRLDDHAQLHGIYQQFLESLAATGTLIGVASKNDPELTEKAFERDDLLLSKKSAYPIEAHWNRKSESVQRILRKWNVLPDSVVFIDDSPIEVAEVRSAFPEMECIVFPKNDYAAFWEMLRHLRDRFGKAFLTEEDSLRLQSVRSGTGAGGFSEAGELPMSDFLRAAEGQLTFAQSTPSEDQRAFELVNKTNQFNLNGIRYSEGGWLKLIQDPRTQVIVVSYQDKFGKLGRISVMIARVVGNIVKLESWVMSCRVFSRRIEFHCLEYLFERFGAEGVEFQFVKTERNGPLVEFLQQLTGRTIQQPLRLSRAEFFARAPERPHHVTEESYAVRQ